MVNLVGRVVVFFAGRVVYSGSSEMKVCGTFGGKIVGILVLVYEGLVFAPGGGYLLVTTGGGVFEAGPVYGDFEVIGVDGAVFTVVVLIVFGGFLAVVSGGGFLVVVCGTDLVVTSSTVVVSFGGKVASVSFGGKVKVVSGSFGG